MLQNIAPSPYWITAINAPLGHDRLPSSTSQQGAHSPLASKPDTTGRSEFETHHRTDAARFGLTPRMSSLTARLLAFGFIAVLLAYPLVATVPVLPWALGLMLACVFAGRSSGLRLSLLTAGLVLVCLCGHAVFGTVSPLEALLISIFAAATVLLTPFRAMPTSPRGLYPETIDTVLNALLDAVPLLLLDKKGMVRRASGASQALFEQSRKKLETQHFSQLVPDFNFDVHARPSVPAGLLAAPGPHWLARRKDKPSIPVELWLEHTPEGPLIRLTDLSPRHAADAQARELHSQLNKVWRLNSLGEMAATLAHELNQPLGAAASYLHAAQEDMKRAGPLGESAFRTTDLAKTQMLRAGQIIRRMRELLTMEMRALSSEKVRRVVEDVLPILTLTGQEKGVQISVDIDSPDHVRMDRIQFQQALVNLVRNAVEASPSGGKVLITGRVLTDQAYEIAVEDSGPGIAPDQVERVFQPMTTTKSGGMGLGLSVTRTIVESHGGHLRVGPSRWGGARFSFNLTTATVDGDE